MRIVHVIDSLGRGGAETLLVNTVKALTQYEHWIILLYNRNEFEKELDGEAHISLVCLNAKGTKDLPFQVPKLRALIRKLRPNVVHSQLYWSSVMARICTPRQTRFFFTNQCLQKDEAFKKRWMVWLEKLTYFKRHTLVSVSKAVEDEYRQFIGLKGRHVVLRNFAEDVFFKGTKSYSDHDHHFRFVTAGRLHAQKNQRFLIEAFARLPKNYTLSIYGQGDLERELNILKQSLQATNVSFKGIRPGIHEVLYRYDVFVMASLYEGFSLAVIEAMAAGLPVVLPDLPVFHEMAEDAGVYFNINDTDDLRQKIKEICTVANLRRLSVQSVQQANKVGRKSIFLNELKSLYEAK